jgi:hypothetical protein
LKQCPISPIFRLLERFQCDYHADHYRESGLAPWTTDGRGWDLPAG